MYTKLFVQRDDNLVLRNMSINFSINRAEKHLNLVLIEENRNLYFSPLFYYYRNYCIVNYIDSSSNTNVLPDVSL